MDYKDLVAFIKAARETADDKTALNAKELYKEWTVGIEVKVGERLRYKDVLYKVLQDHTTQETWTPTDAPSLFAKVLIPDDSEIYPWEQPDSTNPYMKGDKVTHNGKTWESLIDNNTWEPGVVGTESLWKEVA